ncbi:hypothetical protein FRB95_014288 [Tulasnella sp. JGI-2019a]|nr:hypothetical protein FRB95_014288 [Tulasnella sp. JGI-2019a]
MFPKTSAYKLLEAIVEESVAIQYILALGLSGYVDGPSTSKISTVGRYNRLQHHEKAWRTITWRQHNEYTIDRCSSTYELYGGVYAHGLKSQDSYVKSARPITRGMKLIEFPSLLRNQFTGRTWTILDLGVDTQDFGMDPDQDLLVLMERVPPRTRDNDNPAVSVHLLNLRDEDATPHSLARTPLLEYQSQVYGSTYSHWIQVVGDLLAVLFCPEAFKRPTNAAMAVDELVIWNWKTGDCITSIKLEGTGVESFSFLANDTILVPISLSGRCPVINIYRFEGVLGSTEARLMAQYSLPPMANSVDHCQVMCRLDPSPWESQPEDPDYKEGQAEGDGGKDEGGGVAEPEHESDPISSDYGPLPFGPLPSNRIIVLSLRIIVDVPITDSAGNIVHQAQSRRYTAFVKADTFLDFREDVDTSKWAPEERAQGSTGRTETFVKVPWEAWGPKHSRFLAESTDLNCVCYVYGSRYCRLIHSSDDTTQLRVMDFNNVDFNKVLEEDGQEHEDGGPDRDDTINGHEAAEHTSCSVDGFEGLQTDSMAVKGLFERTKIASQPTIITDPLVFEQSVRTELPFRWSLKDAPEVNKFDKVMIGHEHIIGSRPATDEARERLKLDVLTL